MSARKLILAIAISLSIFVLYFGYSTEPEVEFFKLGGLAIGANVSEYGILKIISIASWALFVLYPSKEKDNGN